MRIVIGWIAAGGALLACAGCGFKGPLYLPERSATVVTHPAPAARSEPATAPQNRAQAPDTRKKDKSPPSPPSPPRSG